MIPGVPLPATDDLLEAPFWSALREGALRIQHCGGCSRWYFPPRRRCTACQGSLAWQAVSGRGRIWSYTAVHPPVLPAFAARTPYCVVVVELEESKGLRMAGNVLHAASDEINAVGIAELRIGQAVRAVIRPLADGVFWPHWQLTDSMPPPADSTASAARR